MARTVGEAESVAAKALSVTFAGQVKQVTSRVLASGDKGGRMVIEFNILDDKLIGELAGYVTVDEEVRVTVEKE